MRFSIQKELFDVLRGLTIGVVVAKGIDNTHPSKEIDELLQQDDRDDAKSFHR